MKALNWMPAALLLAGAFALSGCSDEPQAPVADDGEVELSAARPAGAVPARTRAAPVPPPVVVPPPDACAIIPHGEAERLIGTPLQTEPLHASAASGEAAGCGYAAGARGPALRLDVLTARSWQRDDMTLDGYWQSQTIGDNAARRVDALQGNGYWVRRPPPVKRALLVRGDQAVYELTSLRYGKAALANDAVEALAAALLAAE